MSGDRGDHGDRGGTRVAIPVYQVDAFTERAFAGNPAAVVPLDSSADAGWMQSLALEMNLSETAFLWPEEGAWRLRWFTPKREVRLCGHATLAAAHLLWESGRLAADRPAELDTLSGRLTCRRRDDGAIAMDFPARVPTPSTPPEGLAGALGTAIVDCAASAEDLLARVVDANAVRDLAPDIGRIAQLPVRGLIVTAPAEPGSGADFVSRFFAPRYGVPEDPVTGSAHCVLAPYWAAALGRRELVGCQLSPRGGRVEAVWRGDRVELAGRAVTVFRGELAGAALPAAP